MHGTRPPPTTNNTGAYMTMNNIRRRTIEIIIIIGCIFIGASLLQNIEASAEARVISTHHNVFEVGARVIPPDDGVCSLVTSYGNTMTDTPDEPCTPPSAPGSYDNVMVYTNGSVNYTGVTLRVDHEPSTIELAHSLGCGVCITTDGTTCVAGTEIHMPPSSDDLQFTLGAGTHLAMDVTIPAGTNHEIMFTVGDFNYAGTSPTCAYGQAGFTSTWHMENQTH